MPRRPLTDRPGATQQLSLFGGDCGGDVGGDDPANRPAAAAAPPVTSQAAASTTAHSTAPTTAVSHPGASGAGSSHPHRLFHHPQANRDIRFGEHSLRYELRRARRRSIGFLIGEDGLVVSAPRWVAQAEIDAALQAKARWILRKLMDQGERLNRLASAKVDWRDGTELPYLGEPLIVLLDPRVDGAELREPTDAHPATLPGLARRCLHVGLPHTAEPAQIRDAVQSWLQRQAILLFEQRCQHFAQRLGVRVNRLALSSAATRWGSATSGGTVRLHWRLIHFALPTIDYVVAHELAHLREMNHSPAFWEVVRSVMPNYEQARGALRSDTLPVFG